VSLLVSYFLGRYNCGYAKTGFEKAHVVSLVLGNIMVAIFAAMLGHYSLIHIMLVL
jgi:hypothetical protein